MVPDWDKVDPEIIELLKTGHFAAAFDAEVAAIGLPPAALRRRNCWPCTAATFAVREAYEQTPGPRAGEPLDGEGAP